MQQLKINLFNETHCQVFALITQLVECQSYELKVAGSNPAESTTVLTDFKRLIHALLAQSVERRPFKPVVVGSNPTEGAIPGYPSGQRGST